MYLLGSGHQQCMWAAPLRVRLRHFQRVRKPALPARFWRHTQSGALTLRLQVGQLAQPSPQVTGCITSAAPPHAAGEPFSIIIPLFVKLTGGLMSAAHACEVVCMHQHARRLSRVDFPFAGPSERMLDGPQAWRRQQQQVVKSAWVGVQGPLSCFSHVAVLRRPCRVMMPASTVAQRQALSGGALCCHSVSPFVLRRQQGKHPYYIGYGSSADRRPYLLSQGCTVSLPKKVTCEISLKIS